METNTDKRFDDYLKKQVENSKRELDEASYRLLQSYDHETFINGINNKKFKIEVTNQKKFVKECFDNFGNNISLLLLILSIIPYFLVPIICYKYDKWILLMGILGLLLGQIFAYIFRVLVARKLFIIEFVFSFAAVTFIACYFWGIFHTFSFILLCALYQFVLLYIADIIHENISLNYLIKDANKYEKAVMNKLIRLKN